MKVQFAIAVVASVCTQVALAADASLLSADFAKCSKSAESVTSAIMACQSQEWSRQDKRLNIAYQALLARLTPKKADELRAVQRAWLAYEKAKCGFYFDGEDFNGTLNRVEASYCAVVERARRAEELEKVAKW